jgi:phosphatidylinositol kinase/protein kinase (PI-3  family)
LKLKLRPYEILATGFDCGLIEFVPDTLSVDSIRKKMSIRYNKTCDLFDYFRKNFGQPKSKEFIQAQKNFADSLAAYSLSCYVL